MKDFLFIYEGGDPNWMANWAPEKIQAAMEEWGTWFKELETSGHLRNPGAALSPGGAVVSSSGGSVSTDQVLPEVKELIGGFSVVAADSLSEAINLAKGSPYLKNHSHGTVLVRPVLEMEG